MHLDEVKLEGLLSRELPDVEERIVRNHLAGCPRCASAFEAARREDEQIADLLSSLDHTIPHLDPLSLTRRARRRVLKPRLAAAGIALLIVAGAASAMPGSPLRPWLSRVVGWIAGTETTPREAGQVDSSQQPPAGVSVFPGEKFELVFEAIQETGVIRISLADQAEVAVRSDDEGVSYSVDPQGVRVSNAGLGANYEVVIPNDAKSVVIRVRETILFAKENGAIVTAADRAADGSYVVDFSAASN